MCGTTGHMDKMCPGRKRVTQPTTLKEVVTKGKPAEDADSSVEWREVVKNGSNVVAPSPFAGREKKEQREKHVEEGKC